MAGFNGDSLSPSTTGNPSPTAPQSVYQKALYPKTSGASGQDPANIYGVKLIDPGTLVGEPTGKGGLTVTTTASAVGAHIPAVGADGKPIVRIEVQNQSASTPVHYSDDGTLAVATNANQAIPGAFSIYNSAIPTDKGMSFVTASGTADINYKYWT